MKIRVQTDTSGRFKGPLDCFKQTLRREGLLAVYKGVTPPLVATGFVNSCLFGMQGYFLHRIVATSGRSLADSTPVDVAQAAVLGGACISLLVAPMEGVKARLQVNYARKGEAGLYSGPVDCIRKLVTGPLGVRRGLYRGWVPTVLCRMSNYAYFGSYEVIRRKITPPKEDGSPGERTLSAAVVSGALAGVCYWLSCYPMDVIKNRIQAAPDTIPPRYAGIAGAARDIYAEAGWRGFFRGFSPCILRAFPANAACFLAFELMMKLLPQEQPW